VEVWEMNSTIVELFENFLVGGCGFMVGFPACQMEYRFGHAACNYISGFLTHFGEKLLQIFRFESFFMDKMRRLNNGMFFK